MANLRRSLLIHSVFCLLASFSYPSMGGENVGRSRSYSAPPYSGPPTYARSRQTKNPVLACAANPAIPNGTVKRVNTAVIDECKRGWFFNHRIRIPIKLSIEKRKGRIEVTSKLFFNYRGSSEAREDVLLALDEIKPCVTNFYAKYGIHLNLNFKVNSGWNDWWTSDVAIDLWDDYPSPDSANWPLLSTRGSKLDYDLACAIVAHEYGHLLGLPDTYPDPECPDRNTLGPPDGLMSSAEPGISTMKLYPSDLQTIISPLCGSE